MSFKDWYNNNLIVGGFPIMVNNRFNLSDFDIVINVSDEWYPDIEMQLQESFLKTYWFPMNECKSDIGLNSIYGAMIILRRAEERSLRVYLHCHAGVNRSRIVQAAYYFMRTGEHYNKQYAGFINSLLAACGRNYLPPKKSVEKFLLKLNDEIGKCQKFGGMLDLCKLNNLKLKRL